MIVDLPTALTFALAAGATVISPGPDTILILRNALSSGRNVGLACVFGVQTGLIGHTLLAVFGISVIIASSPVLFKSVAILGAAYLAWIGIQGFRGHTVKFDAGSQTVSAKRAYIDGMICNLLNPKVIILFLALLPNFVKMENGHVALQLCIFAGILIFMNTLWQMPLAVAADAVRGWLSKPVIQKVIGYITGVFLIGFAALMLWSHIL
jgi:homoserine/homoserine lactone efflux protein